MTKKQLKRLNLIVDSMDSGTRDSEQVFYFIKPDTQKDIKDFLLEIIYNQNIGGASDLSYEIVASAIDLLDEDTIESEEDYIDNDSASIYTYDRLQYLNINNQDEITEVLKEYETDIQNACAYWYDNQVKNVYYQLKDYIQA